MNKADFVKYLTDNVVESAKKYNKSSIVSSIISYGIVTSNFGSKSRAKNANNIFAIPVDNDEEEGFVTPGNGDETKYKIYDSIESSIEDFVSNTDTIEITDAMKKIIDTYNLTSYDMTDDFIPKQEQIKEELKDNSEEKKEKPVINKSPNEEIVSRKNIIDNDNKQSEIDTFYIRKGNECLSEYPNTLEDAKKICDQYPGYSVCNSKGVTLYTSEITESLPTIKQNMLYNKGRKFSTKAVAIYINPTIKTIYRTYTGVLSLYDGVERNNRYRVCKPNDLNNSRGIIGWVDKSNII